MVSIRFGEGFGAVSGLEYEGFSSGCLGQGCGEGSSFASKYQGWQVRETLLDVLEGYLIGPRRLLGGMAFAPRAWMPQC